MPVGGLGLILGLAAAFLVTQIAISGWAARQLPPTGPVPTHFDIRGKADGFGSRWITLGIMPAGHVLVNALMLAHGLVADEPVDLGELLTGQIILGLMLLATHGFIMFLLLRWARGV